MTDANSSKELNAGGYLATYFYRVPKKNYNAISQNLKKFIPWFVSNGVRLEYYHVAGKDTQETIESANASGMFIMENITKTLLPKMKIFGWSYNTLEIKITVKKYTQR
jgi:hypothetical protein